MGRAKGAGEIALVPLRPSNNWGASGTMKPDLVQPREAFEEADNAFPRQSASMEMEL